MGSQQQFCLRWNNHQSNMLTVFDNLFQNEALVDVTLACEGLSLKAHKMVLSACSPFFQSLFIDNPCKHPIVILKDVRFTDLKALVDFMYKGEVNVSQDQLNRLLKTAETLKVRGLAEVTSGYCIEENGDAGSNVPAQETTNSLPSTQPSFENLNSRSPPPPPQQQMSPPRKRKKAKHRSRGEKPTSHSEQEESDNPDVLEPKVEITEDHFTSSKGTRHSQESPQRNADNKAAEMVFASSGTLGTPTANSRPPLSGSTTQNQSGVTSSTPTCTTSPDGQLSNQSSTLQNLSHDLEMQVDTKAPEMHLQWDNHDTLEVNSPSDQLLIYDSSEEDVELLDIGNEVRVPKQRLETLLSTTADSPTRFVRGLLMLVFSKEEMRGRSVTGRRRHNIGGMQKDALECSRLNAVVDYTLSVFPGTSPVRIRQTISNKLKEVNNSSYHLASTSSVPIHQGGELIEFVDKLSRFVHRLE